jgi:hypothetical protein
MSAQPQPFDPEDVMRAFEAVQKVWTLQLDGLEGMITEAKSRGYTDSQARAMVAKLMGWPGNQSDPT